VNGRTAENMAKANGGTSLDAALDELYGASPAEFTAKRDALAKALKSSANAAGAADVKGRRKPTQLAYVLNQLARRHADELAELVDVGRELLRAQRKALRGDAGHDLRAAIARQRSVVSELTTRTAALMGELGVPVTGHLDEIASALRAALVDPAVGAQLEEGRLEKVPAPAAGFPGAAPQEAEASAEQRAEAEASAEQRAEASARASAEEKERTEAERARRKEAASKAGAEAEARSQARRPRSHRRGTRREARGDRAEPCLPSHEARAQHRLARSARASRQARGMLRAPPRPSASTMVPMRRLHASLSPVTALTPLALLVLLAVSSLACSKDGTDAKKTDPPAEATAAVTADAATDASVGATVDAAVDAGAIDASLPDGGLAPTPPAGDDWQELDVSKADLKVRIPSGATVPADRAGHDAKFAGSFFRVVMPSGYDVLFAERHGSETADVAAEKRAFRAKTKGTGAILYEAADAFVIHRDDGADAGGPYCEVTACAKAGERRICATATGARIDGTIFKKLTDTECFAVVTIARSIKSR
jgi:hypothetical protein